MKWLDCIKRHLKRLGVVKKRNDWRKCLKQAYDSPRVVLPVIIMIIMNKIMIANNE
jgi:hypothetical protein